MKLGDVVTNEYGHTGILKEINYPDEAKVEVFNYGIKDDYDWCSLRKCRLATNEEKIKAFD